MNSNNKNPRVSFMTTATDNTRQYKFNIEFYVFVENGQHIAYCPAIDLSTSGKTFNDAVAAFYECFQLYVETCVDNDTLVSDLIAHGWKVTKFTLRTPTFSYLIKKPEMKKLLNSEISFEKIVSPAQISLA